MGHLRGHRPGLGGSLAQYASWRWIFLIKLPVGVAWPWWSVPSGLVFAVALAATAVAVVAERRAAEPILPPWFWRSRVLAGSASAAFGLGLLVIGPTTFLPTYGQPGRSRPGRSRPGRSRPGRGEPRRDTPGRGPPEKPE